MKINVLALDPGLTNTGACWGTVDLTIDDIIDIKPTNIELVKNANKYPKRPVAPQTMKKVAWMYGQILEKIHDVDPDIIFAEIPSGGSKDANSATALTCCIAMLGMLSMTHRLIVITPNGAKVATGTSGDKGEVMQWAVDKYPDMGWKTGKRSNAFGVKIDDLYVVKNMEHCSDAVAVFHAGLESDEFIDHHCDFVSADYVR